MAKRSEVDVLKDEIRELKETVSTLTKTVDELSSKIQVPEKRDSKSVAPGHYRIFDEGESVIMEDASWNRLLNLLENAQKGLTTSELAKKWGKSRSRTSEVLNQLVDDGHLVKYRDGRRMKFRSLDE
ncbi:MarR family transcriptional regulator [Candidatus Thorarchaeota archaeon]|nr:MAG: MarR family transcriptional regulator [Candidatus Thorarchaeota archaeon]